MLEGLRKAQQNWLGKIIITILFGILIISFSMVFIQRDLFVGRAEMAVTAGKTAISREAFKEEYDRTLRQIAAQTNQQVGPNEARAMQLDKTVLSRVVQQAVIDESVRKLGLAVSEEAVLQSIYAIPQFRNTLGFNRSALESYLSSMQLSENGFIAQQRSELLRSQALSPMLTGITTPKALESFAARLIGERRDVSYYALTDAAAGDLPAPTAAQIEETFQANKAQFRAPEYRSFEAITVQPDAFTHPEAVSDDDARKAFDRMQASGAVTPERRTIQQIGFPDEQHARDALARVKDGKATFDALATEQKIAPEALTLGKLMTKSDVIDPKVAEAAFTLSQNQVSDLVPSAFGPVLLRVTEIQKADFEKSKDQIKARLATERAQAPMNAVRDTVDDMTGNARPFADIAKDQKLPLITIKAIDKAGLDMDGKPVSNLPESEQLIRAVFSSDVGVDNAALNLRNGGGIWYRVSNVIPSRDRTLDEVKDKVIAIWKRAETDKRLTKLAADQLAQIKTAADLAKAAGDAKTQVTTAVQVSRVGTPPAGIPANGLDQIFSTTVGTPSSMSGGTGRVIFLVTSATIPASDPNAAQTTTLANQMAQGLGQDFVLEYIARAQKDIGVTVDQNTIRNAVGGNQQEF